MNTTIASRSINAQKARLEHHTIVVVVNDTPSETKELLVQCLQSAGFDVMNPNGGLVTAQIADEIPSAIESQTLNEASIFPSIPRLQQVFDFIELNYHENIKLKEVAQAVGYSPAYLTDLVKKLTGKTVNSWIIERRLAAASTLLLETDDTVEEIAFKVGYQSINHFYCQFRNYYDCSPRPWRALQLRRST